MKKYFKFIWIVLTFIFAIATNAEASAIAHLSSDGSTITFNAHLYFYGEGVSASVLQQSVDEINLYWNGSTHNSANELFLKGYVGDRVVKFEMQVTGEIISTEVANSMIASHPKVGLNFIKVLSRPLDPKQPHSYMDKICGSTGTWYLTDDLGASTTSAHEFGHGLCLVHPYSADIRHLGAPWIMVPRNTLVDSAYQIDPNARAGRIGGSLNPYLRRVLQKDLDGIYWESMQFDQFGNAEVGESAVPVSQFKISERVE